MIEKLHPAEQRAIRGVTFLMGKHNLSTAEMSNIMGMAGSFEARKTLDGERHLRFVELILLAEYCKQPLEFFLTNEESSDLPDTLGAFLRQRRSAMGYTQEQFADMVGISRQSYNRMENKGGGMKPRYIDPMAKVLGISTTLLSRYLNRKD